MVKKRTNKHILTCRVAREHCQNVNLFSAAQYIINVKEKKSEK